MIRYGDPIEMRFGRRVFRFNPVRLEAYNASPGTPRKLNDDDDQPPGLGATFFVGLNVGDARNYYTPEDLRARVIEIRREQLVGLVGKPGVYGHGASITPMLGYWDQLETPGFSKAPEEESVSVRVLNLPEVPVRVFEQDMRDLGHQLALDFQQDVIPMMLDDAGVVKRTVLISTSTPKGR